MIFTLTCNILAETVARYPSVSIGSTMRAESVSFRVGGKGVNVSRALAALGVGTFAVAVGGGSSGRRCAECLRREEAFESFVAPAPFEARSGWTAFDVSANAETSFLGADAELTCADFISALDAVGRRAGEGDVLALCGSVPGWGPGMADGLFALARSKGLRLAFDTYGAPLCDLFASESEAVKINSGEFAAYARSRGFEGSLEEAFGVFEKECGAKFFAVTDGAGTAFARACGEVRSFDPPKVEPPVFATGCGDAAMAVILAAVSRGSCGFDDFETALAFASRCAASPELLPADCSGILT